MSEYLFDEEIILNKNKNKNKNKRDQHLLKESKRDFVIGLINISLTISFRVGEHGSWLATRLQVY